MLRKHFQRLLILVFLAGSTAFAADKTAEKEFDSWYMLMLQGQPSGWVHIVESHDGNNIVSKNTTHMALRRGPIDLVIQMSSTFVETADGKPISSVSEQKFSGMVVRRTITFEKDKMIWVTEQAGQKQTTERPMPSQVWLPPAAAARYTEEQINAGKNEIQYWTLQPEAGDQPIQITNKRTGTKKIEVVGKVIEATVWKSSLSNLPGVEAVSYTDDRGREVKSEMTLMPGMTFTMLLADEQLAKTQVNPPELMTQTFIRMPEPINNPRQLRKASYKLTIDQNKGEGPQLTDASFPQTGYQYVKRQSDEVLLVTVDMDRPVRSEDDRPTDEHLAATSILNHEDPVVRALADQTLPAGNKLSNQEKARTLRRFVNRTIDEKTLNVGFATASEVARTKEGDCSEHAVLLAALLRAAGIPSRTASGLVYADNFAGQQSIFGYHMWTQAWIEDEQGGYWMDIDAAISDESAFDATHITIAISAMAEGAMTNDMIAMLPVFNRLKIEVLK